ncbi:MAG: hypothetical protein WCS20_10865, partial [Alphaproteobacteria bacterium]
TYGNGRPRTDREIFNLADRQTVRFRQESGCAGLYSSVSTVLEQGIRTFIEAEMRDFHMDVLTDHGVGSGLDNHTHALPAMANL